MKNSIVSFVFMIVVGFTNAQVAINEDGSNPEPSAMLDINSLSKGILIPRMRLATRDAIVNPEISLLIYQSDGLAGYYYFDGTAWTRLTETNTSANQLNELSDAVTDDTSIFLGLGSGVNDDGSSNKNVALGIEALNSNTIGIGNVATGYQTLFSNMEGIFNTAIGVEALYSNTSGNYNIANGYRSLYLNTTGSDNIAIGLESLNSNTTGSYNVANGHKTLYSNTTGSDNIAFGFESMMNNTIGVRNLSLGNSALKLNTIGVDNIAIGFQALNSNSSGNGNIALGYHTLINSESGHGNIAQGYFSLKLNTTGSDNIGIGTGTIESNLTGSGNIAIGYQALKDVTGSFNTGLGQSTNVFNNSINATAIGYASTVFSSHQVRIGNSSVTSIGGYTSWTNVSDARFKKEITNNVPGLNFVLKLRPVTYKLDMDAIARYTKTPDSLRIKSAERLKGNIIQTGFIAQEVEQTAQKIGYHFSGLDAPKNSNDHYGLRYAEFVVPLVKAVQEQQEEINNQREEIEALKILVQQLLAGK